MLNTFSQLKNTVWKLSGDKQDQYLYSAAIFNAPELYNWK